jgi:hypothetical protein
MPIGWGNDVGKRKQLLIVGGHQRYHCEPLEVVEDSEKDAP